MRDVVALPLKIIFDKSLSTGCLPLDWRSAHVSPIFKKGSNLDVKNYRPISLTCIACKILESLVRDNILCHCSTNDLLTDRQFGFIKGRSTLLQLLHMLQDWADSIENGAHIDAVYTDFEKAFDRVSHKHLVRKLQAYGIHEDVIKWIGAFLNNRRQRVIVNGKYSDWSTITSGVPQGSVLGPILFILYINELANVCVNGSKVYLYADDAKIYKCIYSTIDEEGLQKDLDRFKLWSDNWLLKLNISKCHSISFCGDIDKRVGYCLGYDLVENVDAIKDLGVLFDKDLRFSQHISGKVAQAYKVLFLIRRNFRYLDPCSFVKLYKTLVRSHLEYCNSVWSPYRIGDIKAIEKVQMRATKFITSIKHLSYTDRLKHLKLPTLHYRRIRGDIILVYKMLHGLYDSSCVCKLPKSDVSWTRGNSFKLHPVLIKHRFSNHFFVNRIIKIWNGLPDNVVSACSLNSFKNCLDNYWSDQEVLYDWHAVITGSGSRSKEV